MEGPHWHPPATPSSTARSGASGPHARTLQPRFPPGVYRHRAIEEVNAQRKRWDEANFAAYRKRLGKG